MKKMYQPMIPAIIILLALVMSAFCTMPAHADDGTPPTGAPAAPAVTQPTDDSSTSPAQTDQATSNGPTDPSVAAGDAAQVVNPATTQPVDPTAVAPATDANVPVATQAEPVDTSTAVASQAAPADTSTPVATQSASADTATPAVDQAVPTDTTTTAGDQAAPADAASLLASVPSGTEVVVTNLSGDPVPLGSQEAAQTIITGDPMWCPTGVNPGGAGCTTSQTSFSNLLPLIQNKTVAGTIWIESTVTDSSQIILSSTTVGTTANYALTLTGGWNGALGTSSAITGTSTFNVPLTINWNSDVTLSNIIITGLTDSSSTALQITTPKSVTLTRVRVNTNAGKGAVISYALSPLPIPSSVTVSSSDFSGNTGGDGLDIYSKGAITLNSVTANNNSNGIGALVADDTLGAVITITGANQFNQNGLDGLEVWGNGPISLSGITANDNGQLQPIVSDGGYGALVDNDGNTSTPQAVSILGSNQFNNNWLGGLNVWSFGTITLNGTTASGNGEGGQAYSDVTGLDNGVYLNNCHQYHTYTVLCTTVTATAVNITGTNTFSDNYGDGLYIESKGAITLNSVTSNNNGNEGALVENDYTGTTAGITFTGSNQFSGNGDDGLDVDSNSGITLNNVTANSNTGSGAVIENDYTTATPSVILTGTSQFDNNGDDGLDVYTAGTITLNNITANGNGTLHDSMYGTGVFVENAENPALPQSVSILGTNVFNYNWLDGLDVWSFGSITLNNTAATSNAGYGAILDNCPYDTTNNVCYTVAPTAVNITGTNTFSGNQVDGLDVFSKGAITLNGVTANSNAAYGVWLENDYPGTTAGITMTGTNQFNTNGEDGLDAYTKGAISANSITASYNGQDLDPSNGWGAELINDIPGATAGITLTGTNIFNGNEGTGLGVWSYGAITVNNVTANGNISWHGIYLQNNSGSSAQPITVNGSTTNDNNWIGLDVFGSKGLITLSNIIANNNGDIGAHISNTDGTAGVTLNGINTFSGNGQDGLDVYTYGVVTLNSITANGNGTGRADPTSGTPEGYGVYVNNAYKTTLPLSVSILGTNQFNGNWLGGLYVQSYGTITLNSTTASSNGTGLYDTYVNYDSGATLDNCLYNSTTKLCTSVTPMAVNLTGTNTFSDNSGYGLGLYSKALITLTGVAANSNGSLGAWLENDFTGASAGITLTTDQFNGNGDDGFDAYTRGAIMLTNVDANGNEIDGAYLNNTLGTVAAGVSLSATNVFSENGGIGLEVHTNGAIAANNLVNNSNGMGGAWLDNCGYNGTSCTTTTVAAVTLTGSNQFKFNAGGLVIFSNGAVTLNSLTANNNSIGSGVWVDNTHSPTSAGVTLTGTNLFNENNSAGLFIFTHGPVTASNLSASNNGYGDSVSGYGVEIENYAATTAQLVTLTGTNYMNGNNLTNLYVYTKGVITINNLLANNSKNGMGAWLNNQDYGSLTATPGVTITGYATFNNNYNSGLNIWSWGAISLANVTANNNGQSKTVGGGVYLDNCLSTGGGHCTATLPRTVTFTGNNTFNGNFNDGLQVYSLGAITANNVKANNNGNNGAYLENDYTNAVGGVSVNNASTYSPSFNNNGSNGEYDGLDILSRGTITVMDLDAQSNSGDGVYLINTVNNAGTAAVTLGTARANWFNVLSWNCDSGLEVYSNGLVTLSNLDAENNGHYNNTTFSSSGYGVWVDNSTSSASQGVTLNGTNNKFKNNYLSGLEIRTKGAVTLNNIEADNNGYNITGDLDVYGYGAKVDNTGALASQLKGVTIAGYARFNSNADTGLSINSLGAITLTNLDAENNGSGALLDNHGGNPGTGITFTGNIVTSNNNSQGMDVLSRGLISFNNLTSASAANNGIYGWNLDNDYSGAVGGITMSITASQNFGFASNGGYGLLAQSLGAITTNDLDASENGSYGATLDNAFPTAVATATITVNNPSTWDNQFNNNGDDGLDVLSNRLITITSITAQNNGQNGDPSTGWGAFIDNCGYNWVSYTCTNTITPPPGVALNGASDFENNAQDGLWLTSKGAITASNLTGYGNNWDGAYIDNQWGTGSLGGITLSGTNDFENNGLLGLTTYSTGAITMNNVSANNNSGGGALLDNCGSNGTSCTTPTVSAVTLTGYNYFVANSDGTNDGNERGLDIFADGAITINNLMASLNDGDGAYLDNCLWNGVKCTGSGNITLTGINSFTDNSNAGLNADTHGNITLNNVIADNNGGVGVIGDADGSILLACGSMTNNGGYGWALQSEFGQTVTLKGVFAYGNNGGAGNTYPGIGTFIYQRTCP